MCVASKGRSDHYHREAPQPMDGDIARIQMEFMFVGAETKSDSSHGDLQGRWQSVCNRSAFEN